MDEYDDIDDNEYETVRFEDGHIEVSDAECSSDSECDVPEPDEILISILYEDLKDKSVYSGILDVMNLGDLYLYISTLHPDRKDTCNWDKLDITPVPHRRYPKFKEWALATLDDTRDLYLYISRNHQLNIGCFEGFMEFCYEYSASGFPARKWYLDRNHLPRIVPAGT